MRLRFDPRAPGWVEGATRKASPNFDARARRSASGEAVTVDLLVIHYISLPAGRFSGDAIVRLFTNRLEGETDPQLLVLRDVRVSAHFLIRRRGECLQFVGTDDRAWHAGVSKFFERQKCNDFSIGIELEGDASHAFTQAQYRRLKALTQLLAQRHPLRYVVGHSDIAPGRKEDPGPQFDWPRYLESLGTTRLSRPF
jgi:N-acetyl-anhydromuramoyl-L-alanine amidase